MNENISKEVNAQNICDEIADNVIAFFEGKIDNETRAERETELLDRLGKVRSLNDSEPQDL